MGSFPCTQCGACCRFAGAVPNFPEPVLPGTQQCVHLDSANRCVVYSTRPEVCRIAGYHELNAVACNTLQLIAKVPAKYRIILPLAP